MQVSAMGRRSKSRIMRHPADIRGSISVYFWIRERLINHTRSINSAKYYYWQTVDAMHRRDLLSFGSDSSEGMPDLGLSEPRSGEHHHGRSSPAVWLAARSEPYRLHRTRFTQDRRYAGAPGVPMPIRTPILADRRIVCRRHAGLGQVAVRGRSLTPLSDFPTGGSRTVRRGFASAVQ